MREEEGKVTPKKVIDFYDVTHDTLSFLPPPQWFFYWIIDPYSPQAVSRGITASILNLCRYITLILSYLNFRESYIWFEIMRNILCFFKKKKNINKVSVLTIFLITQNELLILVYTPEMLIMQLYLLNTAYGWGCCPWHSNVRSNNLG